MDDKMRYQLLSMITNRVLEILTPNGKEALIPFIHSGGGSVNLGLNLVEGLTPNRSEKTYGRRRDHLISVHLSVLESCLFIRGYSATGHLIRILAGNYMVASKEEKQAIIREGFPIRVGTISKREDLALNTPLRRVTDSEYSAMYERLLALWKTPRQKQAAEMMWVRLGKICDLLPKHKIGQSFIRQRQGRDEPLPLYVRNEIHHPSIPGLKESKAFEDDKRIGYAIMEAWLFQDTPSLS